MADRRCLDMNVYEATQRRLGFIFENFDNVIVSFSGGKDSGVLLHLVRDFVARHNISERLGLFHQDMEAQFSLTTEYVDKTFKECVDMERYWWCIPLASRTAVSNYQVFWYPWDDELAHIWVRDMPDYPYVYTLWNNPMGDYYKYKMDYNSHTKAFERWFHDTHNKSGRTVALLGTRTAESLHRYNAVANKRHDFMGQKWITQDGSGVYSAVPLYDWSVSDIWHCNAEQEYPYNKIYDMFYKAGVPVEKMRVASPFHESATASLSLYRVLEPAMWCKLLGRVNGANFAAIYGETKAMGYNNVSLPEGHTWKSYVKFLLATLPEVTRRGYIEKFKTSIRFWHRTGGGLSNEVIEELIKHGYRIRMNGVSNYSKDGKARVVFLGPTPDSTDDITVSKDLPSWKRMAICILKNDHLCKYMGFGLTREQDVRRKEILAKYKKV